MNTNAYLGARAYAPNCFQWARAWPHKGMQAQTHHKLECRGGFLDMACNPVFLFYQSDNDPIPCFLLKYGAYYIHNCMQVLNTSRLHTSHDVTWIAARNVADQHAHRACNIRCGLERSTFFVCSACSSILVAILIFTPLHSECILSLIQASIRCRHRETHACCSLH